MSCKGRCDEKYNSQNKCHCNSKCGQHNNCCNDYTDLCESKTDHVSPVAHPVPRALLYPINVTWPHKTPGDFHMVEIWAVSGLTRRPVSAVCENNCHIHQYLTKKSIKKVLRKIIHLKFHQNFFFLAPIVFILSIYRFTLSGLFFIVVLVLENVINSGSHYLLHHWWLCNQPPLVKTYFAIWPAGATVVLYNMLNKLLVPHLHLLPLFLKVVLDAIRSFSTVRNMVIMRSG